MEEVPEPYLTIIAKLGPLSPDYRTEGGVFLGLEGVILLLAIFAAVRECRNRAQFAALYVFIHRMLIIGSLLHVIELAVILNSTYGPLTGYIGSVAANFKQLPPIACLFYFIGVTFEVYQREFLPGRANRIKCAWRVLALMLLGFIIALIVSLVLMFATNQKRYNVITTIWEGVCFILTFFVVVTATCRLQQAGRQRRQSLGRRASSTAPGNPMTPLIRKVFVISIILCGCFVATVFGTYAVFLQGTTFGGAAITDGGYAVTVYPSPPPTYIYWDWLLLDVMYVTINSVITVLAWKAPRSTRAVEDSDKKSVTWDRKSSGSSKQPRMPLSPLSLNTQHSQDSTREPNSPDNENPPSPTYSRERSTSDYALSG